MSEKLLFALLSFSALIPAIMLHEVAHGAARELVFAVAPRERRVARPNRERMEDDFEIFVGVGAEFAVEEARNGVSPAPDLDKQHRVAFERRDDRKPGTARGCPAEHRHGHAVVVGEEASLVAVPFAVVAVGAKPVAGLALVGVAE